MTNKAMNRSVVLFDKEHVKSLEFDHRIPPTSIGVRRTRPSSKAVMKELKNQQRAKKQKTLDASNDDTSQMLHPIALPIAISPNCITTKSSLHDTTKEASELPANKYFHLQPDKKEIQEEIDEILSADRTAHKNLPAYLTAPMAMQAAKRGLLMIPSCSQTTAACTSAVIDDDLGQIWSDAIAASMKEAEEVRAKEDMRPMAYRLVPEPWKRLRESCKKDFLTDNAEDNNGTPDEVHVHNNIDDFVVHADNIRPRIELLDEAHCTFYDCLYHQFPNLHISCGAKFGSDYLFYDGNRKDRHAFAGVRILTTERDDKPHYPLPTSYDMHGFVRCLNSAGKLALLATVVTMEGGGKRVVIVDLALEKVLNAPTHLRKQNGSMEARKKLGENLAK